MKLRVVAIKLPPEVAENRRRKAKQDRHSKSNHSQDYLYRLGGGIFVTNVPVDVWTPTQVAQAYRLRWRIEIIFITSFPSSQNKLCSELVLRTRKRS